MWKNAEHGEKQRWQNWGYRGGSMLRCIQIIYLLFCLWVPIGYADTITTEGNSGITSESGLEIETEYGRAITDNNVTWSNVIIDCHNTLGQIGLTVYGTGFTGSGIRVVRCPGGAFLFYESATLSNSLGYSAGNDIMIASGKSVTGTSNRFGDAGATGAGTYSDVGSSTKWGIKWPVFGGGNFLFNFMF